MRSRAEMGDFDPSQGIVEDGIAQLGVRAHGRLKNGKALDDKDDGIRVYTHTTSRRYWALSSDPLYNPDTDGEIEFFCKKGEVVPGVEAPVGMEARHDHGGRDHDGAVGAVRYQFIAKRDN